MTGEKLMIGDLMIGDWVNFLINIEGGDTEYDPVVNEYQPMRIESICAFGEVDSELGVINDIAQLQPIPLTAEILEKNGFVKDKTQYDEDFYEFWSEDSDRCIFLYVYKEYFLLFDNSNIEIKYVHELQHALRLCNIEKEIEL